MVAVTDIVFDDISFKKGDTYPDSLGSITLNANASGVRSYTGLKADVDKLPTIASYPRYATGLATGSSFFAVDTFELYMYNRSTDTWYTA